MATIQSLSPLDWLMPRSYIRQLLFFRAAPTDWADRLQAGLAASVADIPHLAGAVVNHADPPGSVALLVGPAGSVPVTTLFSRQDLTDALDYDVLRGAHFPPSALRDAFTFFDPEANAAAATGAGDGCPPPPPVFRARLTRVRGGAVLAVAVHHATTDITGLGALLGVWAAHCRGDAGAGGFTPAWCDRTPLCNLAPPSPPAARVPDLLFFENDDDAEGTPLPVPRRFLRPPDTRCAAGLFALAAPRLRALRDGVARALAAAATTTTETPWVSTADVLTAVLYSAVFEALHGDEAGTAADDDVAEISVPVNFRTRGDVPLPAAYLGAAFGRARVRVPVRELREVVRRFAEQGACDEEGEGGDGEATSGLEQPAPSPPPALYLALAPVALAVRRAIAGALAGPGAVAKAVAFAAGQADVTNLRRRPARALSLVSWADEGIAALVWGNEDDGPRCDAVRLPAPLPAGRNYLIVLPRLADGGLEVLVGLERAAMARFVGAGALVSALAAVRWVEDVV